MNVATYLEFIHHASQWILAQNLQNGSKNPKFPQAGQAGANNPYFV
jgi:hypothetical protein